MQVAFQGMIAEAALFQDVFSANCRPRETIPQSKAEDLLPWQTLIT